MYDLIIIGAGPGGYEAAIHAGKMKKKVLLVEKEHIGGTCLNVGCIPTKTFLHSAKIYEHACDADKFGVSASDVSFDMGAVLKRKNGVVEKLTKGVQMLLKGAKVETVMGKACITGIGKVDVDGTTHEAKNILIATGSRPAKPPIPGADSDTVVDSTGILNLDKIPASLTVIGGGVIGIEFASFFASVGAKVQVVEMLDTICPGVDSDIVTELTRELKKQKIKLHLSAKVEEIKGSTVVFSTDGKQKKIESDLVLMSTGRALNIEDLGLDETKVDYDKKGIKVDPQGRTNIAGIWACGDVTGRCLLAHSATREGQVSVNTMFGEDDTMRYHAMPAVVYCHPEVASAGMTEDEAKEKGLDYKVVKKPLVVAGRYQVETESSSAGLCKVVIEKGSDRILGVHMIGGSCSEMIWGAAALIENEIRVVDATQIIFPHPTVSEAIKETIMH